MHQRATPRRATSKRPAAALIWFSLLLGFQAQGQSHAQTGATSNLETVLKRARAERVKYTETFKNLTADETKVTEVFDGEGRLKKRRELVASFIVYQSQNDGGKLLEFHVIREVDGKPVRDYVGRTEGLFARIAKADSWEGEWSRIHRENTRHRLKYERWGVTLYVAGQIQEEASPGFNYGIARGESIDGRETIILSYRRKGLDAGEVAGRHDRHVGDRGRVWLDAETLQIRRWENEKLARHEKSGANFLRLRDEVTYARSDLGILVPRRIVTEFYEHISYDPKRDQTPRAALSGRITFTYDSFKRFDVTSREELNPVKDR